VRTGVVGSGEGSDDKLPGLDRGNRTADLLDDAAVLVPHRRRLGERANTAVGPQVGPADAGGRDPDDGIGWLDNLGLVALLEAHVAWNVKNSSFHSLSPLSFASEPFTHKLCFDLFQVLAKEGCELVELNKFHPVVKIHVAGVRNDDQFLWLTGKPVCIFTELSGMSGIPRDEKHWTR
jgi:hypothetical protein